MMVDTLLMLILFSSFCCMIHSGSPEKVCKDYRNRDVPDGASFVPNGEDPCTECLCESGEAQACVASVCSIPHDCRDVRKILSDQCCKFICFDRKWRDLNSDKYNFTKIRPLPIIPFRDDNSFEPGTIAQDEKDQAAARDAYATNYTLRLGFTTMTTVVILICLMFSVHRLRKRRLRALQALAQSSNRNRRIPYDEDHVDGCHYEVSDFDSQNNTFTRTDPPPPPYKQSHSEIDLPPPYDQVILDIVPGSNPPITGDSPSEIPNRVEAPT